MHVDFLVGVLAVVVAGHVAGDDHHGDGVEGGVGHAGEDVGQAGTQVAHDHGGLAGDTGVAVGGGGGHGLMAVGDVGHLLAAGQGIQHTDDRVAAQTEDILHIPALQIIYHQIRNKFFAHNRFLLYL